MMKFIQYSVVALSILLMAVPLLTRAQCTVSGGVEFCTNQPVPVPYNLFFIGGPAGSLSASQLLVGIINILLALVGILAVLFLIIGGFRYVTAAGNEEQAEAAKKTITNAILGLVIVILSFVVIRVIAEALIFNRK